MIKKKAKGKKPTKKAATRKRASKKELDPAQVRKEISEIVKAEASEVAVAVLDKAKHGELAPVKYLWELAGVYPAVKDGEHATEEEDCLAKTLLARIDAPKKPAEKDEDELEDDGKEDTVVSGGVMDNAEPVAEKPESSTLVV